MDNKYEEFLARSAVINIKNESELQEFISLMKKLGFERIKYVDNIYQKYGFEKGFHYNYGIRYIAPSSLCFEYHFEHGFVTVSVEQWKEYDPDSKIYSLDDIKIATGYYQGKDNEITNRDQVSVVPKNQPKSYFEVFDSDTKNKSIDDYKPFKGFYDLRKYQLPKKIFLKLWNAQEQIFFISERKEYYQKMAPVEWEKALELSGRYQLELFQYPLKKEYVTREEVEEELEK